MTLIENGLGVPDGARGNANHYEPTGDKMPGVPDVVEDGFCPRNSGRGDLYPHAPQHYRGPVTAGPAVGRLDEALAPESAKPKDEPPAVQFAPPRPAPAVPAAPPAAAPVAPVAKAAAE